MVHKYLFKRTEGTFNWIMEEPELIWYAVNVATLWLQREFKQKGRITADHLDKACGILSEEIFAAELTELNMPYLRTVPLLNKVIQLTLERLMILKFKAQQST